jgi:hypothetical protein
LLIRRDVLVASPDVQEEQAPGCTKTSLTVPHARPH